MRRTDPGQCTPPSPFPPPPPPLGDSRCIHTHTHRPGCVNSWEAGLSNEMAATTRALPPGEQSPKRREEAGARREEGGEEVELGPRGQRGWPEGWGCSGVRALRRRWCVPSRLGRAHTPPRLGLAGGGARPPASPELRASSRGRGRRKSSRDVRVPGKWAGGAGPRGAKRKLIGARSSFTPSTMGCGHAHHGSRHQPLAAAGRLRRSPQRSLHRRAP